MSTTVQPIEASQVSALPEFADHKGCKALFGLSRAHLYSLVADRKIKSVSLRQKGALRGRRLFDCQSIRDYLKANYSNE